VIARIYAVDMDVTGRSTFRPDLRRRGLRPTFPFGRYFSKPLSLKCESIRDVRKFLSTCTAINDKEQFGKDDYWQPPDEFEKTRKGDCDCYGFWTWRQLLSMGYEARLVFGECIRYGIGHVWITFEKEGQWYLVEPQLWVLGERTPTLSTVRYKPRFSVAWSDERVHWYQHKDISFKADKRLPFFMLEWLQIWGKFWARVLPRLPLIIYRKVTHKVGTTREPK
jgi:hypothetical protein